NYLRVSNINGSNGTYTAVNSIDEGNNTGWTITEDPSNVDVYWINGTGNWSDPSHWSTGCIPGPNNNVIFDASSFTGNQTVTVDIQAYCHDMTWTALVFAPTFAGTNDVIINGSMTLHPSITASLTGRYIFNSTATETITTNNIDLNGDIVLSEATGEWTLADAIFSSADV